MHWTTGESDGGPHNNIPLERATKPKLRRSIYFPPSHHQKLPHKMDSEHPIPTPVTGSAVRSPPHDPNPAPLPPPYSAENHTALVPRATSILEEPAAAGSPVRSPVRSAAENHTTSPNHTRAIAPPASSGIKDEAVTGSPVRSPLQSAEAEARYERENSSGSVSSFRSSCGDAENPTASPGDVRALALVPRAMSIRGEAVAGSPVRSPHREANSSPAWSGAPPRHEKENSFKSVPSLRSPLCDAENPTALPQYKECVFGSPTRGAMTVGSILLSPLADVAAEDPSLEKLTSPMVAVANRMVTRETTSATRVGGRGGGERGSTWVESGTSRQPPMRAAAFGLRILALILSLISFSVMAADKSSGWDDDSFDRYREFRYCLSMNVLVFVYSLFQVFVQIYWKIKRKWIMSRLVSYYFDFFMDQILAYLLMSASSSAASRNGDWVNDFGSDDFTKGINGSLAMSFLAFFALAFSSIISAYKFFTSIS